MEKLSKASKALHRSSKSLRDSTPPGSPHRSHFGSLRERKHDKLSRSDSMKFQISAPVELISSTSMISYTSKSLRSPSPTGRTASSIGYVPTKSATSSPAIGTPMSPVQSPRPQNHIVVSQKPYHYQPPSPASASGESVKGPFAPEVGLAISDVLTPPATPPPEHFPHRSRSSSIGKNAAMNAVTSRQSGSIHRIRSTSSLSSSISAGSSHESYKLDNEEVTAPSPDPRRTTTTFGPTSYKSPSGLGPRSSGGSTHSSSSHHGPSVTSHPSTSASASPAIPAVPAIPPMLATTPTMPPPPPRVSARRSASNPNMKVGGQKRSMSKSNPFAHELAQVSELAEDMGLDLVDNDIMVRKGLLKFSAKEYLEVIRTVVLYPLEFSDDEEMPPTSKLASTPAPKPQQQKKQPPPQQQQQPPRQQQQRKREEDVVPAPIVPVRRKPTVTESGRQTPTEGARRMPVAQMHAPKPVQQQNVAVGGWI